MFCGQQATAVWHKSRLPLVDGVGIINDLPADTAGWPVCSPCRVAIWAVPFGCRVSASRSVVITAPDVVERAFAEDNVAYARGIITTGATDIRSSARDGHRAALQALEAALQSTPDAALGHSITVWLYSNANNPGSTLKVWRSTGTLPDLWRRIRTGTRARDAWRTPSR